MGRWKSIHITWFNNNNLRCGFMTHLITDFTGCGHIQRSLGRLIRVQLKPISNITSTSIDIVDPSKMWLNLKIIIFLEWTHEEEEYSKPPSLTTTMSLCRRLRMSLKNDDDSFFGIFMTKTPLKISLPHQISVRSSRVFISSNYQSSSSTSRADNGPRLPNCKVVLPKWV